MKTLRINLSNCFGIQSLEKDFTFSGGENDSPHAYAIYAPNGTMKTSFTRTFENLSRGELPIEQRYNRPATAEVIADETPLEAESIYVFKTELDARNEIPSITNILVNPENKSRYDDLLVELDKQESKLKKDLSKLSGLKQNEIKEYILLDWQEDDIFTCLQEAVKVEVNDDLSPYIYSVIFDPKALELLETKEFSQEAEEFNRRYQELFEKEDTIYAKGVFNPSKAETSFKTLSKQGFFAGGHRVHLKGYENSLDEQQFEEKLRVLNASIENDDALKAIKNGLAKNAKTDALAHLIEQLTTSQFRYLLENLKADNRPQFKKLLWAFYIQKTSIINVFIETFQKNKVEIEAIELAAAESAPRWERAVQLFNDRFVDMPFKLAIPNQTQAVLGRETAILNFIFKDDEENKLRTSDEVRKSLSQGERRALNLLKFIFDVEARKLDERETVFILDDIADSFDYKNKHAIIQYLRDLTVKDYFYQIILTHNFDFFRAISMGNGGFVHRARCLMTTKTENSISLSEAKGVSNYFVRVWKPKVHRCNRIMYATIPFTRNLIEYTTDDYKTDKKYLNLTSLLHWKSDTNEISIGEYLKIYNEVFNVKHDESSPEIAVDMLFSEARKICDDQTNIGLNLEDKVVLSIAIRIMAEKFLTEKIRVIKDEPDYWYQGRSDQYRGLMNEYKQLVYDSVEIVILEKVGITVNSNIHLNSFMYEPILDLTIDHLVALFREVSSLGN